MITVEEIRQLQKDRETFYSELHAQQIIDDDYYELVFDAKVPESMGYEQRTPPSAREWVDIGIRHYTLDNPKAKVYSRGDSDAAREKDAKLEAFYNFWLRKVILQLKDAAKKLLLRGEVFLKVWIDDTYFGMDMSKMSDELKEETRQKKRLHFPLTLEVVDPVNVYCSPAHNGLVPVDVIEEYKMTVAEAKNLCSHNNWEWNDNWDKRKYSDKRKKSTALVKWTSYIDGTSRCFMIEDSPLLTPSIQPNILKFCPYVHIGAGFGNSNYEGKPEYLYRSILYARRDMLKMESRVLSQLDAQGARHGWQQPLITGEEEDVMQLYPGGRIKLSPNIALRQTDRVKVEILDPKSPPAGLFEQLAIVAASARPPSVLAGTKPTGVYSAQGIEDLIGTSKPIYKDAIKNLEAGLAVLMGMGARIISEVYKDEVAITEGMESE